MQAPVVPDCVFTHVSILLLFRFLLRKAIEKAKRTVVCCALENGQPA